MCHNLLLAYVPTIVPPCLVHAGYHFARMEWMMEKPEMAWDDTPEEALEHLRRCKTDRRKTAVAMLAHGDGTVVFLGMDLVVQEAFEDGDVLLARFKDDKRWESQSGAE